jgi:hypothetical protein
MGAGDASLLERLSQTGAGLVPNRAAYGVLKRTPTRIVSVGDRVSHAPQPASCRCVRVSGAARLVSRPMPRIESRCLTEQVQAPQRLLPGFARLLAAVYF